MARVLFRTLNAAEREVMQPHLDALQRAQRGVRLTALAFERLLADAAVSFDPETLGYYRNEPEPTSRPAKEG